MLPGIDKASGFVSARLLFWHGCPDVDSGEPPYTLFGKLDRWFGFLLDCDGV